MKRTDHIFLFTSNLLKASQDIFDKVYQDFNISYELDEIAKPDKVSIGGRGIDDRKDSFHSWISDLRNEGVLKVRLYSEVNNEPALPSYIENAFAGYQELLLEVTTAKAIKTFYLQSFYSATYNILPEQFVALIDSQKNKETLWRRMAELLLEGNALNNRPAFDANDVRNYILHDEDCPFDMMVNQLVSEIQIDCILAGSAINIPSSLASLFYKSDFSFGALEEDDKEYVYLYPLKKVNADNLLALVEAQTFSQKKIWEKATEIVKDYEYSSIPHLQPSEWPAYIKNMSPSELDLICGTICRAICVICEDDKVEKVIPDLLSQSFGPDEEENKRAKIRSRVSQDQWQLTSNEYPWEMYFFEQVNNISNSSELDEPALKLQLTHVLNKLSVFAKKINSPYWEPFELGYYLLSNAAPSGDFDETHLALIKTDLIEKGFSEIAVENFEFAFLSYSTNLKTMQHPEKIYGFMTVSFCDVFGGMGSWNDIYIEDEEDNKYCHALSSDAFVLIKQYFAALLSA